MGTDANEAVDLVARRLGVLTALMDGAKGVTELAEVTDSSRSTANRAVRELEEAGLVERADGGYAVTLAGRLLTERYLRFREEEAAGVLAAEPVLTHLPPDCPVDTAVLAGCRVETATETAPYRPRERLLSATRDADRVRVALPALGDLRYLRSWHELVAGGGEVELLATEALFADLDERFPRLLPAMATTGRFTVRVGDVPDLGLALVEKGGETAVLLAGFGDDGVMRGVIENDSDDAVRWGERCFGRLREGTDERRAWVPLCRGDAYYERGDCYRAEAEYETRLETARAAGDRRAEADCLRRLGAAARKRGEYDLARERHRRSFELRREVGDKHGEAKCLLCLARVARDAGDPSVARERFADALDRYRAVGDGAGEATVLRELGSLERQRGEHDRARERLAEAADRYEAVDDPGAALDCLEELVECCEAVGDDDGAREYCQRAVELAEEAGREKRADTFREHCRRFESAPA
jgi:predicted transcriptional regulator/Tfp pilus assembly protein PilF